MKTRNEKRRILEGKTVFLLLLSLTCFFPSLSNGSDTWGITTAVDSAMLDFSMAVDSNNKVHISYYGDGKLYYATNAAGAWAKTTVDTVNWGNCLTAIAVDLNNKIHIGYGNSSGGYLKYATNVTGSWVTSQVDTIGGYGYGIEVSIAIDSNNKAHMAYRSNGSPMHATNASGSWIITVVDNEGGGQWLGCSIAVDKNDKIHMAYRSGSLEYKYATNATGSWVITTVDAFEGVYEYHYPSFAIDSNNKIHMSYYDPTNHDLKYATNTTGSWIKTTVDSDGDVGRKSSIAVDKNNKIHISYYGTPSNILYTDFKYATNASGSWVKTMVESIYGSVTETCSIVTDGNNKPHISYNTHTDYKYATNAWGSWTKTVVTTTSNKDLSIGVDSNNKVHISTVGPTYTTNVGISAYTLSVTKRGDGSGAIASVPDGINCGSICSASFDLGATVTLGAAPNYSTFGGWSGDCSGSGNCTITMDAPKSVNAIFGIGGSQTYNLTITKTGSGTGSVTSSPEGINCGSTCSYSYYSGAVMVLTATASAGSTFAGWGGACSGTGACAVTVDAAKSVTATFNTGGSQTYNLTVTKAGSGTGSVSSSPTGINCGATCSASFNSGTAVTLTAAASAGSTFTGWGGACTGTGTCSVTMSAAKSVTASFSLSGSNGPTNVCGDVYDESGGPWTLAGTPYIVTCDVNVPQGKTLTIDPGVEVKFNGKYGIDVFGVLAANGTESQKIIFTSNNSTPARGNWKSIYFEPGGGISSMNYCIVEYGGGDTNWGWANIAIDGVSTMTVNNTISRNSYDAGMHVFNKANPTITNSEFSYNTYDGINIQIDSYPVFRNNRAHHNDRWNGITVEGGDITKSGVWYSDNVPYVITDSGATSGNRTIVAGVTLTIEPGTVIKFKDNGTVSIYVNGTLNAQGTTEKPIIFTSLNDDAYFGDTNNNGPSSGSPGDWEALEFAPESNNNILTYCTFKYGGKNYAILGINTSAIRFENNIVTESSYDGIAITNASPTISGSRIINNRRDGIACDNASPTITYNIITGNAGGDGIYTLNGSNPVISNNEIWGNRSNGVNNDDSSKCIDARNNWWGDPSGPYDNTNDTGTCPGYNPNGKGDQASSYVNYADWKTVSPSGAGPVQWWPFNENTGTIVYDSTPYKNIGMTFGPTWADSKSCGKALNFNGTDNYVELPAPGFFGQGTISGWISFNSIPSSLGTYGVDYLGLTAYKFGSSSKKDTLDFGIDVNTKNLYFGIYSSGSKNAVSTITPQTNKWYHFSGTWGPDGMKFYIDGELKGQNTYTGGIPSDTKFFYLGTNSYGGYANARMDEIRVYNYAQSQAEIQADMAKCSPATTGDTTPPTTSTSVPEGSYNTAQTVALTSETGATIYYTTDGTDPRTSTTRTQYTGPISITATTTLKYSAIDQAGNAETAKTATYTIAATGGGNLLIWGGNKYGQLGNGTTTDNPVPFQLNGLTNVIGIAGGHYHSMALRSDGTVWAWGSNVYGELGDGTTTDRYNPVQVNNLSNVIAIASRLNHSMALKSDGTVWTWGYNYSSQLGDGTEYEDKSTPVQANGLTDITAIAAGNDHSMALKSDGTVWAWGYNAYGQVGDVDSGGHGWNIITPVQVVGLRDIVAIAGGPEHSIALKSDGTVWTWGRNNLGQLGNGTKTNSRTPVQVGGLANIIAIAGGDETLALKSDGTVWGNNESGPIQVSGLANITAIAVNGEWTHYAALKSDGTVWTWGYNHNGQLGIGTIGTAYDWIGNPTHVSAVENVTKIATGGSHVMVIVTGSAVAQRTLTVTKSGTGTGTVTSTPVGINCGTECTKNYASGTSVTLTANSASGSVFIGWSGACTGTGTCSITMDAAKSVTAVFSSGTAADTIVLSPGWNFISFPKQPPDTSIAKVLENIISNVRIVWGYNNQTKNWLRYKPSDSKNTLASMESGKGYWIYMNDAAYLDMTGWGAPIAITLYENWNLVGYTGTDGTSPSTALSTIGNKWEIIWTWESGGWSAKHETATMSSVMPLNNCYMKKAYWVKVKTGSGTVNWINADPENVTKAKVKAEEGTALLNTNKNFTTAKDKFAEALSFDPENPEANTGYALCSLGEKASELTASLNALTAIQNSLDMSTQFSLMNQTLNFLGKLPFIKLSSKTGSLSSLSKYAQGGYGIDINLDLANRLKELLLRTVKKVPVYGDNYFNALANLKLATSQYMAIVSSVLPFIRAAEAKVESDPDFYFLISTEMFKKMINVDIDQDGTPDVIPLDEYVAIDAGDIYAVDGLLTTFMALGNFLSAYNFIGSTTENKGDVNGDGFVSPDEYFPATPYYTLVAGGAEKLANAWNYLKTAIQKLEKGVDLTLAETKDYYEIVPVNTNPDLRAFVNSLKQNATYMDLQDLKGLAAGAYTFDLSKGPFYLPGHSIKINLPQFFAKPHDLRFYYPEINLSSNTFSYKKDMTLDGLFPDGDFENVLNYALGLATMKSIPIIREVLPLEPNIGETVTIKGEGFGSTRGTGRIYLGNTEILASDIVSWSDSEIKFKISSTLISGKLFVMVNDIRSNGKMMTITGMIVDNFDKVPAAEMAGTPPTTIDSGMFVYDIYDAPDACFGPSNWAIIEGHPGYLLQTKDIYDKVNNSCYFQPKGDPNKNYFKGSNLVLKDKTFTNFTFTGGFGIHLENWVFEGSDNDGIGIVFRYQNENNYYRLISLIDTGNGGPFTRLEKWVNGTLTVLGLSTDVEDVYKNEYDVVENNTNTLKVDVDGTSIKAYVNNRLVFSVSDSSFSSGRVGVSTYAQCWTWLDYIAIQEK